MTYTPRAVERADRYKVSVGQYTHYHRNGFLVVKGLLTPDDVATLANWSDDIYRGNISLPGLEEGPMTESADERMKHLTRVHMLHRISETAEWALLHPRVLDVLEALIGPDIYALQSMLFFNPPGRGGQGWHQDAYYIPTLPDTLIGAWIALEPVDEANGCLWVAPGSNSEPIYPPVQTPSLVHANGAFSDLSEIEHASHLDDTVNTLSRIVSRYQNQIPVVMNPGDVLFFHSHLFHRSYPNRTENRFRRSYVCHYCNGRSWVPWNHGAPFEGDAANCMHILARGQSHLPYATPQLGTKVQLTEPTDATAGDTVRMMGMDMDGTMDMQVQTFSEGMDHDD